MQRRAVIIVVSPRPSSSLELGVVAAVLELAATNSAKLSSAPLRDLIGVVAVCRSAAITVKLSS